MIGTDGSHEPRPFPTARGSHSSYRARPALRACWRRWSPQRDRHDPGGLTSSYDGDPRTATLADPADPLSLQHARPSTLTRQRPRPTPARYDAATPRRSPSTTPAGRRTRRPSTRGPPVQEQVGGLAPVAYAYDARGRLATVTRRDRTGGAHHRPSPTTATASWPAVTDPLAGRYALQQRPRRADHARRPCRTARRSATPTTRNGNAGGAHPARAARPHLRPTPPAIWLAAYTPPDVGRGSTPRPATPTTPTGSSRRIDRPDGQTVDFGYDARRPARRRSPGRAGQLGLRLRRRRPAGWPPSPPRAASRSPTPTTAPCSPRRPGRRRRGQRRPGPTTTTSGVASQTRQRRRSSSPSSTTPTACRPGRRAHADAATPSTGCVTGTTLGVVTDAGATTASATGRATRGHGRRRRLYAVEYTRDALGRITQKTETIGGVTRRLRLRLRPGRPPHRGPAERRPDRHLRLRRQRQPAEPPRGRAATSAPPTTPRTG